MTTKSSKSQDLCAKILFLYPNERGMSTVPAAIAILSKILKDAGHITGLFDTTYYKFDDELTQESFKGSYTDPVMTKTLNYRPVDNMDDEERYFKKTTQSAVEDFRAKILEFDPDLIAVSCTETTFKRGLTLIQATKDLNIPNLFGGVFPTFAPDITLSHDGVDMICVGEGENALLDIANSIANGTDYYDASNCWYKTPEGETIKNPLTKPVNVNEMPAITDIGIFGEERFYRPLGGKIRRLLPVETHRGCPYTCAFCNSPGQNLLYGGGTSFLRKKTIPMVEEEIKNHIKEWKVEYIYFWADTFLAWSEEEFDEFCDMYKHIKLPFWCQTRTETVSEYRMSKLKEVGLDRISFGMEHGNETFRREVVKRNYTNKSAIEALEIVSKLDIPFAVNNIIGFPDETRELAFDTIELNRSFNSDTTICSIYMPFHGTQLRTYAERKGYIAPNVIASVANSDESMLTMPQWDKEDISRLRSVFAMYIKFPKERWPEIKEAETDPVLYDKLSAEYIEMNWANPKAHIEQTLKEAAKGIF